MRDRDLKTPIFYNELPLMEAAKLRAKDLQTAANNLGVPVTYGVEDALTLKFMKAQGFTVVMGEDGAEVIVVRPTVGAKRNSGSRR